MFLGELSFDDWHISMNVPCMVSMMVAPVTTAMWVGCPSMRRNTGYCVSIQSVACVSRGPWRFARFAFHVCLVSLHCVEVHRDTHMSFVTPYLPGSGCLILWNFEEHAAHAMTESNSSGMVRINGWGMSMCSDSEFRPGLGVLENCSSLIGDSYSHHPHLISWYCVEHLGHVRSI